MPLWVWAIIVLVSVYVVAAVWVAFLAALRRRQMRELAERRRRASRLAANVGDQWRSDA